MLLVALLALGSGPDLVITPPTTLLPFGTTSVEITVSSQYALTAPTWCTWSLNGAAGGKLSPNSNETGFIGTVTGLVPGSNVVTVGCSDGGSGSAVYRAVPDVTGGSYPKTGNLWGSYNFDREPLSYAASRVSLWLGSDWNSTQLAALRGYNPHTVALTSINACEAGDGLPEDYYLHNVSRPGTTKGRLESWPGSFRLDVTRPEVQNYQAGLMYALVVLGGSEGRPGRNSTDGATEIVYDGLFVDNVFIDDGFGVNRNDIHNNRFFPCTAACGCSAATPEPDTPACFGAAWRGGIVAELEQFRAKMPHALMDGHAMGSDGPAESFVGEAFNAISIGFDTPEVIEGLKPFSSAYRNYHRWNDANRVRSPHITMVESAVRLMFGYGYGFDTQLSKVGQEGFIPAETLAFASREYRYMRFGLTFTLLEDGYFTHEIGDSFHGQDWRYDESDFNLGTPTSNATVVNVSGFPPPPPPVVMNDFLLWVNAAKGASADLTMDMADRPPGIAAPSAKVAVATVCDAPGCEGFVELHHDGASYQQGMEYTLRFWAKATPANIPIAIQSIMDSAPWSSFGLSSTETLSTQWTEYEEDFVALRSSTSGGKVTFLLGATANTTVWIAGLTLQKGGRPAVFRRDFDCGIALINGDTAERTVDVGSGFARLRGLQAPMWQYILDDNTSAFQKQLGVWDSSTAFEHGYSRAFPTSEQNIGPYFHSFYGSLHLGLPGATAKFDLGIRDTGQYNISLWWPRAKPAMSQWNSKMVAIVVGWGGKTVASVTADLTQHGDRWHLVAEGVKLSAGSALSLVCPATGGNCVADAVLVESAARFNDGAEVQSVRLAATDGIILRRQPSPAGCLQRTP